MARTAAEIEASIDLEAQNYNELDELQNNSSMVSFWTYTKKIVVFAILMLEKFFDQHKTDIEGIIENTETGSIDWYLSIAYGYQHGDSLIIENNRPVYSTQDESKKIIKRVMITEDSNATMHFKVAKEVGSDLGKLDLTELAAFTAYMYRRKIAGTKINVNSIDADELDLQADVVIDPILFDLNGKLLLNPSTEPVLEAIEAHIKDFDPQGTFALSKLIDKVMDIEGVKDFYINSSSLNTVPFTRSVSSNAGYLKLDANTTLNYVLS